MKVVAYLFYIGDSYYVFKCYNINEHCHRNYGEICPHGMIDERYIQN